MVQLQTVSLQTTESESPETLFRRFMEALGIDTQRPGLEDTPARVVRMYHELLNPRPVAVTHFENEGRYDGMVQMLGIPFYSLCEHHLVPFYGEAHIAYMPSEKLVGLSKLARFVEQHARALQVQERMTAQIADTIEHEVSPEGVAVIIDARHMCVEMRGVQKPGVVTRTAVMRGVYTENASLKAEFMDAVRANQTGS